MNVQLPDGTVINDVPDGMSKADLTAKLKSNGYDVSKLEAPAPEPSLMSKVGQQVGNLAAGAVRGAGSIGATLLAPVDAAARAVNGGKPISVGGYDIAGQDRRAGMDAGLKELGAQPDSLAYQAGKLGGEVAGTAGAGGALANVAGRIPGVAAAAPNLLNAVRTAGMTGGNAVTRAAGGAITGGASAGLVNPADAGTGAIVGGALPGVLQVAGKAGNAIGNAVRGGGASPDVAALAQRAKDLGIDIPADRLVNSKPMNAVASALNYVPFSGRAATEQKMAEQLDTALSRTFGQDSPNVTMALRKAQSDLGGKFDATLKGTPVAFDKPLLQGIGDVQQQAAKELGPDGLHAINAQIDEIVSKGADGVIDGQAAYNIKRALDRISERNAPEAFHARELKKVLMGALDRSLGPEEAAAFSVTRKQYGNMLDLENLAQNGAEGGVSVGRLANLKNIGNKDLQELADIAAQFVKTRESQHGAMQRAMVGVASGATGGLPGLVGVGLGGRLANKALNSNTARSIALGEPNALQSLANPAVRQFGYRAAPLLGSDR